MFIRLSFVSVLAVVLTYTGCSVQEPVATSIKKRLAEQGEGASGPSAAAPAPAPAPLPNVENPVDSPSNSGDELALKGKSLYENNCMVCHGAASTSTASESSENRLNELLDDPSYGEIHITPFSNLVPGDTLALSTYLSTSSAALF